MVEFPTTVSRFVCAGDWHGNTTYAKEAIRGVGNYTDSPVIIHVGDFGYQFKTDYLDTIQAEADRWGLIVMFVDGNHEDFSWLNAQPVSDDGVRRLRERVWHLPRGFRWEWFGKTFLALGGAYSVDRPWRTPGIEWWPDEQISFLDAQKATQGGSADVMITHDCPFGVDIPGIASNPMGWPETELVTAELHRKLLRNVFDVVKPKMLIHGHYHVRYDDHLNGTLIIGLDCDGNNFDLNLVEVDILKKM